MADLSLDTIRKIEALRSSSTVRLHYPTTYVLSGEIASSQVPPNTKIKYQVYAESIRRYNTEVIILFHGIGKYIYPIEGHTHNIKDDTIFPESFRPKVSQDLMNGLAVAYLTQISPFQIISINVGEKTMSVEDYLEWHIKYIRQQKNVG